MELTSLTLNALSDFIDRQKEAHNTRNLVVTINQGNHDHKNALVLIHPIGGDVYFYRDLARALPSDQPIYALRSPMLDGYPGYGSIEQMARSYLDILKDYGLGCPHYIGGSSFGGAVAYEMAQQLSKANERTPLVILIDTPAYQNLPISMSQDKILEYLVEHGVRDFTIDFEKLRKQENLNAKINYLAQCAQHSKYQDLFNSEFLPRYLRTWQSHDKVLHSYCADVYKGDVLFFSHSDVIPDFPSIQAPYWRGIVEGNFDSVSVSGTHLTMNAMPHVQQIADYLVKALNSPTLQVSTLD